ncbi:hypothetical protein [Virgibacillus litoralis]|uniref:Myosin heavy subunit n=1 Tax=Virgibacillus litoralis TaxID=578221 RepID=A0ABS4HAZ3_9BACI|nr:hypothetical protein [Virgibacillus litoralis]MBP1948080.1 myosin heavy subunit [Virgibacillus litoralis]
MKNTALISFIFILVFGLSLMPAATTNVSADSEDSSKDNGNSGGFIIETKKVEGQMDLVGALQGKVTIKEGIIHGLTITKVLETGGEQEPMVIRIKSPGPIHVKDLYAETIDGTPPNIGGLCAPSKVGWVCLSNVVMKVSKQTVSDISLPNTKIEACYKSECGNLPDYSPTTKEKIQEILEEEQEEQSKLDQIKEELEDDKQKLGAVGDLIDKATETYEKVKKGTPSDELVNLIEDTKNLLRKEIEDGVTDKLNNLVTLTERMEKELQSFQDISGTFSSIVDESSRLVKELENSINTKQEKLTKLTEKHSPQNESEREQAEVFSKLLEMTETKNDGNEAKSDETKSEETTKSEIDIQTIKEGVEKVTKETEEVKEKVNSLKVKEESIQKKTSTITDSISSLKDSITETEKKASSKEKENTESNTDENANDNKKEETETETESESDNETDPNSNETKDEENDGDSSQDEETTELEDVVESIFDLFQVRLIIP